MHSTKVLFRLMGLFWVEHKSNQSEIPFKSQVHQDLAHINQWDLSSVTVSDVILSCWTLCPPSVRLHMNK